MTESEVILQDWSAGNLFYFVRVVCYINFTVNSIFSISISV